MKRRAMSRIVGVLRLAADDVSSLELQRATGLSAWRFWPAIVDLERAGVVVSRFDDAPRNPSTSPTAPRRKLYRLWSA